MNIDLGCLGKAVLEEMEPYPTEEGFTVIMDGYTESGIRVHGVVDTASWLTYPHVWNNAIMIKVN